MYALERFGSITLSPFNNSFPLSPVPTKLNLTQTASGVYDNDGSDRGKQIFPFALPYNCVITEDVYNDNRAVLDELRAAVGTQAKLYRRARDDDTVQWCMAKLPEAPHDWPYTQRGYFEITLGFQQLSPWVGASHGIGWELDDGVLLDDGRNLDEEPPVVLNTNPKAITITNNGNLPVDDIQFSVMAGSTPITRFEISTVDRRLVWTGSLTNGEFVTIDAGACGVQKNGSNDYNSLLAQQFNVKTWAQFKSGANILNVALTGGGTDSTIFVIYRDKWA